MSRKAQPRCKRLVPPPGSSCWLLLVTVAELAGCVRGRSRAPSARASRRGADPTPAPRACSLFPRGAGARARPVACSPRRARSRDPRGGAGSAIFPGSRARAAPGPCSPSAGDLPLEPHLSLSFLTCSRLSPVLSLTPKWPSTSSTVFVCAFSMAAGARPASPPVPAASSPPPRTRTARSCHPGCPGADWLLPLLLRPLPPRGALNHPRAPSRRQPLLSLPGPGSAGRWGLATLPLLVRREGLPRPQPPARSAGRGPPSPLPALLR